MATDYSSTAYLIPAIKRHALVPIAASTLQDADFLAILNEELLTLTNSLAKLRQEFFVRRFVDTALSVGVDTYPMHTRALGTILRDAVVLQTDGSTRNLNYWAPEQSVGTETQQGQPQAVFLDGWNVVVRPVPSSAGESLRLSILERPNAIVAAASAGKVSSATTTVVTLTGSAPGSFTTSTPLDVVEGRSPFRLLARDITPTNVAGAAVTFASGVLPSTLLAGDYLALAQESPLAQLPLELHPVLTLLACANALDTLGEAEKAQAKRADAGQKARAFLAVAWPRLKGGDKKMANGMDKWSTGGWSWSWGR